MKETYLTADQITSAFKISKEKLSLMVKYGFFPRPIKLNERATLWKESAVKNWVEALILISRLLPHSPLPDRW
jgi:predicted DNA-binding transcriptional regulator AlpA